ncbi:MULTISPECIES: TlpA disulfide reductase family protein [Exiguobacterium]|uniref:TlpA disulfide reductase family protein n=1 Tax=Exiguobacterium marinum TaxID=273528 RepID=A0ABY7X3S9_9BACL|nr:TlpA disulfide reductase family protein [Exiguobacterium marinum]WDH76635.1 TlpA disulfide reductase family protein [Exiguobacterium marinum]
MVAIGPLNIRLDLLIFLLSLVVLYGIFRFLGLTSKQREAVIGTWFYGFLAWKGSAIVIGLLTTRDISIALYATGGIWAQLIASGIVLWLVYRLDRDLLGYWVLSGVLIWLGMTLAVPIYGTILNLSDQPIHLWSAVLILLLLVTTWRWMHEPTRGNILWTVLGASSIWLFESYAVGQIQWWMIVITLVLFGLTVFLARPSRKAVQFSIGVLVVLAVVNATLPERASQTVTTETASTGLNIGQIPPSFELKRTDGSAFDLESLRGKLVVVNFWASWCPPCRAEMPDMAAFAKEREDVIIVAVNTTTSERDPSNAVSFVEPYEDAFTVVYDRDGQVGDAYRIQAMPTTYVLDESGVIIAKQFGAIDHDWLDAQL